MISIVQAREWSRRASARGRAAPGSTLVGDGRIPVVILGAGVSGTQTIEAMTNDPSSCYLPVALLDDDPAKWNASVRGVPVRGTSADLVEVAELAGSAMVVVAIPRASGELLRSVTETAAVAGLTVRVLPTTGQLMAGTITLADIRDVSEADLLGRRDIETDFDSIARYLRGRRVLVTGAGGTIGSELCRQIQKFEPATLTKLDRDESALYAVQMLINGGDPGDSREVVVANIRDSARIDEVFAEHQPEVVFHAAALKHLALLELHPVEAWKTNVEGTNHVLRAAAKVGVTHFVNVSSDKAADPTSVLGYSKRIAEQLTVWYSNRSRGDWVSVRFGSVLGSPGSVLETIRDQIEVGGPVTLTHPDATRRFISPSEACQLIIQAATVGHRGEALVLDMGEPVRVLHIAERFVASVPERIDILFTGLRPGEKLHEALVSGHELDIRRAHPLISHVNVPALTPARLGLLDRTNSEIAKASMARMCGDNAVPDGSLVSN